MITDVEQLDELYKLKIKTKELGFSTTEIDEAIDSLRNKNQPSKEMSLLDGVNTFCQPWLPLKDLTYNKFKDSWIVGWCEFAAGSEARLVRIRNIGDKNPFVFADVKFISECDISQSVVCWTTAKDVIKNKTNPYSSEFQQKYWRTVTQRTMDFGGVRSLFVK